MLGKLLGAKYLKTIGHILDYIRYFVDIFTISSFAMIKEIASGLALDRTTVWDRVPKEDAANFESDTFL